jgi:adhesin transport system membrane fusion protein
MWFEIEEVTRGMGRVVPSTELQVVQSLEGGIVAGLEVFEGQMVEAGDILVRIDDTRAGAERGELLEREAALMAEEARMRAEAAAAEAIDLPEGLAARAPLAVAAEHAVFVSRRAQLQAELRVLEDQAAQRRASLREVEATRGKLEGQLLPLRAEVALTEDLVRSRAVPQIELLRLQSREAELAGELAVAGARIPALEAAIREAESQIAAARSAYTLQAQERAARIQVELAVVREGLRAAEDRVVRTSLRAPVRGTVNRIHTTTAGAVVQPGAPILEIVPDDDRLLIEAEVRPEDVAFLRPGDPASVKITAYDYLVYGSLPGEVVRIGADTVSDSEGREFFQVAVRTATNALPGADGQTLPIGPGMVAQVDIQTGSRTVMSYLLRPVMRARAEALRER